jgi:acid phosphatase (class A)
MTIAMKKLVALIFLLSLLSVHFGVSTASADQDTYLPRSSVDLARVLAPPPAPGSEADKADLRAVLDAQQNRTPAEAKSAQADAEVSVFCFADVIGPSFKAEDLPVSTKFFERVRAAESPPVKAAKLFFNRPRPFVEDTRIHPIVGRPPDASYPSGHSTFAYTVAIILADMLPEKAAAIFERAAVYSHNRVVGGVHYPSDIEAGRISAAVIDNVLMHDANFLADYGKARTEVRRAAGLR